MATRAKDQHGPGKEKRGTSPSYPRHTDTATNSRRSPSAPSPSRPPDQKHAPLTTTSEKRIPNYLKPTVSSAPNPSTQGKTQTTSNNTAQKPALNRRRSFDKPPSPNSGLQKSHTMVHPKDKTVVRSSSNIVPKTSSSVSKPHQDRFLKAHRDAGKSHALSSVNKKTTAVKKQNVDATASAATLPTKASSLPDLTADTAPLVECHKEEQESSVTDVEEERELQAEESKSELPPHVPILEEDQKEDIKADTGGSSQVRAAETVKNQNQEIKTFEPSNVLENQNESLDVHVEGAEDGEEIVEETRKDESHESLREERVDGDDKEGEESATENSKDKSLDKKEEVGEGSQTECKEREKVVDTVTETKTQMENTAGKQQQQRQGKKETQAYNDVIEETASKLREKRKNKVKALVGAFETVISLQEPEA
ncbi:uncharacterized protein LOC131332221 [Rhododendron vialii]|uniref:uncharacterized protein LOC131332221 n=1 Tax=Rhododendron vialii TaxID=182163 RepID=UPI00265E5E82|nr:uncharacterized protein LOC131332221 [Rhododendron vialii]XP_058222293.1 uncharacterized protein LOC131332221 [Rhododendron vialii]XP_058222294.1 uncharacterized protein LOC131332221 [Rhododendron vialii]